MMRILFRVVGLDLTIFVATLALRDDDIPASFLYVGALLFSIASISIASRLA
jgi:hypothetical protein